ncbi:hypothetical protein MRX96_005185 [Rhipicephalus microplus]
MTEQVPGRCQELIGKHHNYNRFLGLWGGGQSNGAPAESSWGNANGTASSAWNNKGADDKNNGAGTVASYDPCVYGEFTNWRKKHGPIQAQPAAEKQTRARRKFASVSSRWRRTSGGQVQVNKPTLLLSRQHKNRIAPIPLYNNGIGSVLLLEVTAGALRALIRKGTYDSELVSTVCLACGRVDEITEHIVNECTLLNHPNANTALTVALGFGNT